MRLYSKISNKILDLIISGEFSAGSRLPTERELAERFKVSRPTIREAIIALEVKEIVTIKAGSGVFVISDDKKFDYTNDISAFELLESRVILESEAAALAARMITDDEIILLEKALQKLKLEINQTSAADREFHTIIAIGTHNKVLEKQINHLWNLQDNLNHIDLTRKAVCVQENAHARFIDHENIYNAIKNRDSKMARKSMQHHFKDLMDALHNMSEQKALDEAKNKALNIRKRFNITDHT